MGASTLRELAHRGAGALGIDRFVPGHAHGSSHGGSRVVRCAYFEHPDYVPLLTRSISLWHRLESARGRRLLHRTDVLLAGKPGSEVVRGSVSSACLHGLAYEGLNARMVNTRYPMFRLPPMFEAMLEPETGFVRPEWAVEDSVADAVEHGATVMDRTTVAAIHARPDGVTIETDRGEILAERVVVTVGPWCERLVPWANAPVRVSRQVIVWLDPDDPVSCTEGCLPTFCIDAPEGFLYGCPMTADQPAPAGLKVAWHIVGETVDPDGPIAPPTEAEGESVASALARYVPGCRGRVAAMRTCLYSNSPDGHFLIGPWGDSGRVTVASGFSGHGFKFMPVLGEALADLALRGSTRLPIGFLSAGRFS
jgi:sarcosine oxidase